MTTTNKFLDIGDISFRCADYLTNVFGFTKTINREYDDRFAKSGAKIGSIANVRLPGQFRFSSGTDIDIQALNDASMPIALNKQYQQATAVSGQDWTLSVDAFSERYLNPMLNTMAAEIDVDGLNAMKRYVGNAVGTPGTAPTTQAQYNTLIKNARTRLNKKLAPAGEQKKLITESGFGGDGFVYNTNVMNPQGGIGGQNQAGSTVPGPWGGFAWSETELVPNSTVGTYGGTPAVNGTLASGASVVNIDGLAAGSFFNEGDVITFAGCYDINEQTKVAYPWLKQFSVVEKTAVGTSFNVTVSPAMVGADSPRQNVSALPADNAAVSVLGATGTSSQLAFAYTRDVMMFATADLDPLQGGVESSRASVPELGLSVLVTRFGDIRSFQNLLRIDLLGGWAPLYPQLGVKLYTV